MESLHGSIVHGPEPVTPRIRYRGLREKFLGRFLLIGRHLHLDATGTHGIPLHAERCPNPMNEGREPGRFQPCRQRSASAGAKTRDNVTSSITTRSEPCARLSIRAPRPTQRNGPRPGYPVVLVQGSTRRGFQKRPLRARLLDTVVMLPSVAPNSACNLGSFSKAPTAPRPA